MNSVAGFCWEDADQVLRWNVAQSWQQNYSCCCYRCCCYRLMLLLFSLSSTIVLSTPWPVKKCCCCCYYVVVQRSHSVLLLLFVTTWLADWPNGLRINSFLAFLHTAAKAAVVMCRVRNPACTARRPWEGALHKWLTKMPSDENELHLYLQLHSVLVFNNHNQCCYWCS